MTDCAEQDERTNLRGSWDGQIEAGVREGVEGRRLNREDVVACEQVLILGTLGCEPRWAGW